MKNTEVVWDKNSQMLLVLLMGFNLIPHTLYILPWVSAAAAGCLLWKTLHLLRGYRLPPQWFLYLITASAMTGVVIEHGTLFGREAASTLLVFLGSLKVLEAHRYRDAMLVTFTSYFLLMAHLLNSISLLSTVYMAADVLLITTLMFQLHKQDRRNSPRSFRPAIRLLLVALPVWVFLFLAFPRFSSNIAGSGSQDKATTGFSDTLEPGDVQRLSLSQEPAFRVSFTESPRLSPEDMYWRGAVLVIADGLRWLRPPPKVLKHEKLITPDRAARRKIQYEMWIEPLFKKWLFPLDYPRDISDAENNPRQSVRQRPGFIYETEREANKRSVYTGIASVAAPLQNLSEEERNIYLQVPADLDPRIVELAERVRGESTSADEATKILLDWFIDENFRYTLNPGPLPGANPREMMASFLLATRQGFCEHFAASYSMLMRLIGHPARVVTGFQGGQVNEFGGYLIVRNSNAHAWSEIWIEEDAKGSSQPSSVTPEKSRIGRWKRVDPTGSIAPLRLQLGGDFNRLDPQQIWSGMSEEQIRHRIESGWRAAMSRAALAWDAAQMSWSAFLLRYDFNYQQFLFSQLGLPSASHLVFMIWVLIGTVIFITILYWTLRRKSKAEDPILVAWRRFGSRLEASGVARGPTEGPLSFARRAAHLRPEQATEINDITAAFISLRYTGPSEAPSRSQVRSFIRRTQKFRVKQTTDQQSQ